MSRASVVREIAEQMSAQSRQREINLRERIAELERTKAKVEALITNTPYSPERLASFQAEVDGALQCPRCWIRDQKRTALNRVGRQLRTPDDQFICPSCGFNFYVDPE
jgi:hypothetical protein